MRSVRWALSAGKFVVLDVFAYRVENYRKASSFL